MGIDLSKFLQLYFDESTECLQVLECQLQGASQLSPSAASMRQTIRAAHSIKGSSGAFGFDDVLELAQALELALLQVERQETVMSLARQTLCLEAVNGLRQLLQRRQQGLCGDAALAAAIGGRLAACPVDRAAACG
ncbi:Hpt domain-containing protein [Uliginosibacterium sp. 31-16]|uniref:Hpt domain-containing protein n=1 Tax=Uliginosibacterium sp. 31-16 TaxID=3068315 RepID=UPI00273D10FA|nr:Hpt domain-containing protein [Uliginosibacterium sp. 31-16]MDP5240288.1 Hpt domain-containing protein [Uliginosibacterium sp. 31-16]